MIEQQQHRLEQQLFERASQAQYLTDPLGRVGRRRGGAFSGRSMADLFCPEALRADLASRPAQSALMLDPDDPRMAFTPDRVHEFHTLFPLDAPSDEPQVGSLGFASRVYKALSELDGGTYVLRKFDGVRITGDHNSARKQWAEMAHPSLVRLRNIFITSDFDGGQSNALTFVHDFVFGAATLEERHMRPPADGAPLGAVGEELVWCYAAQLMSALRFLHGHGRALRCLHASKVLVTAQHRVLVGGTGILDVVGDRKPSVADLQVRGGDGLGRGGGGGVEATCIRN
jgi:PAB-dependent poly(A)-specific ribonuclease subunit 3